MANERIANSERTANFEQVAFLALAGSNAGQDLECDSSAAGFAEAQSKDQDLSLFSHLASDRMWQKQTKRQTPVKLRKQTKRRNLR